MAQIVVVTSGKGGTGKTTIAVNLSRALALQGDRVLVVDADVGLRNIDIFFDLADSVVYDFLDVYDGYASFDDAAITVPGFDKLYVLSAPQSRKSTDIGQKLSSVLDSVRSRFDFIIVDCPAGIELGFANAVTPADYAILVTRCYTASIRDADRTIDSLEALGVDKIHLLINSVDVNVLKNHEIWNLNNILDTLGIPLIGVVPYDVKLQTTSYNSDGISAAPFENIAKRLHGIKVPLASLKENKNIFKMFQKKEGFLSEYRITGK